MTITNHIRRYKNCLTHRHNERICSVLMTTFIFSFLLMLTFTACSTTLTTQPSPVMASEARWVLLPVQNFEQTSQAGEKVEAILTTLLHAKGIIHLDFLPDSSEAETLPEIDSRRQFNQQLKWAQQNNYTYAITGSVEEWRYKSGGIRSAPAVGISLQVIEVSTGKSLWSSSGSRTGWGGGTVSGTAQKLLRKMMNTLLIK